jgi:hypothetical protein
MSQLKDNGNARFLSDGDNIAQEVCLAKTWQLCMLSYFISFLFCCGNASICFCDVFAE